MERLRGFIYSLNPYVLSSVASVLTVVQVILAFFFHNPFSEALQWVGWICLWTAGVFGVLPIYTLRRKGGVPQGESYVKTTRLVDTGIYAIVRHPQGGVAWLLINLGMMLVAQHWLIAVLGLTSMPLVYLDAIKADRYAIEKFGDDYRRYMEKVPRVNFISGILRLIQRRVIA
jgi:protein-S-isoprenylcysteine O-methyltransferase Ste14